eukprot:Hpha_TRINITY_DN14835_c0_g2::TRINITY_DN14835_c0_g2_i1::g.168922::m.168922
MVHRRSGPARVLGTPKGVAQSTEEAAQSTDEAERSTVSGSAHVGVPCGGGTGLSPESRDCPESSDACSAAPRTPAADKERTRAVHRDAPLEGSCSEPPDGNCLDCRRLRGQRHTLRRRLRQSQRLYDELLWAAERLMHPQQSSTAALPPGGISSPPDQVTPSPKATTTRDSSPPPQPHGTRVALTTPVIRPTSVARVPRTLSTRASRRQVGREVLHEPLFECTFASPRSAAKTPPPLKGGVLRRRGSSSVPSSPASQRRASTPRCRLTAPPALSIASPS